jgi:hypothetical protein
MVYGESYDARGTELFGHHKDGHTAKTASSRIAKKRTAAAMTGRPPPFRLIHKTMPSVNPATMQTSNGFLQGGKDIVPKCIVFVQCQMLRFWDDIDILGKWRHN